MCARSTPTTASREEETTTTKQQQQKRTSVYLSSIEFNPQKPPSVALFSDNNHEHKTDRTQQRRKTKKCRRAFGT